MYAEFDLTSLPTTVNLCNSGNFLNDQGYDLIWIAGVGFNVSLSAYETLITAHTPLLGYCSTPSPADLASSMQATLFHLDPNNFADGYTLVSGLPVTVDIGGGKIIVQADRSDPVFSGLSSSTQADFFTTAGVVSSPVGDFSPLGTAAGLFSTYPQDLAPQFSFGDSFTDPADDVCTASQDCVSSATPQIDLIGGTLYPQPVPPPPIFGANTIDVEFDLKSLPTTVDLCNSANFLNDQGYDLIWVAGVGLNVSLSAYETLITAHTPLLGYCTTPSPADLASSMQATLFHLDPNNFTDGYTFVDSLPVTVDIAGGKILVQADRSDPAFSGLSTSTQAGFFTTTEVISSYLGDFSPLATALGLFSTYPQDLASQFTFGDSFTDPGDDVCTADQDCVSSATPQIDLIGGTAHMDDYIFRNAFD